MTLTRTMTAVFLFVCFCVPSFAQVLDPAPEKGPKQLITVNINDRPEPLDFVINLARRCGMEPKMDYAVFVAKETRITAHFEGIACVEVLGNILRSMKLDYALTGNVFRIDTPAMLPVRQAASQRELDEARQPSAATLTPVPPKREDPFGIMAKANAADNKYSVVCGATTESSEIPQIFNTFFRGGGSFNSFQSVSPVGNFLGGEICDVMYAKGLSFVAPKTGFGAQARATIRREFTPDARIDSRAKDVTLDAVADVALIADVAFTEITADSEILDPRGLANAVADFIGGKTGRAIRNGARGFVWQEYWRGIEAVMNVRFYNRNGRGFDTKQVVAYYVWQQQEQSSRFLLIRTSSVKDVTFTPLAMKLAAGFAKLME